MMGRAGGGVPLEGAPESLVECVTGFLAGARGVLRTRRAQDNATGSHGAPAKPGAARPRPHRPAGLG
jgi:hypothetical protein